MNYFKKIFSIVPLVLLTLVNISCDSNIKTTSKISVKDFFRNPEQSTFRLSPNGEFISFLKPFNNRLNLYVVGINNNDTTRITEFTDRDIKIYIWANDSKIIFAKDEDGDENFKLYSVGVDGSNLQKLSAEGNFTTRIINELIEDEEHIIISNNSRNQSVFDVYRLNIEIGEKELLAENPGNIIEWIIDHDGKVRCAISTDGVNTGVLYRKTEEEEFELVTATNFKEMLAPIAFTFDNKYIYAISNIDRDKGALIKYDIEQNKEIEVIFEHYDVDINRVFLSRKKEKIAAVSYQTWKTEYEFFDEEKEDIYRSIKRKVPGKEISITNFSRDEQRMIVRSYSDKSLGEYYFYNSETDELILLSKVGPWLNEDDLSSMKPISYKASDGLTINGYLTIPNGGKSKHLPVVVVPHGGPSARDVWEYNHTVQFLANRGYAVLQVNYRGSYGYGRDFWEKGFREWGGKMQEDIADGVRWLIKQEIADPNKIAMLGISFGGYCTFQSLVLYDDLYKCGVTQGGMNNLLHLVKNMPNEWRPYEEMFYEMVGDPKKDKKMLIEISPYFNIDKINSPILIAQGKNDKLVDASSTEIMVKKMKKLGLEVEFMFAKNEGHVFQNEENRIEFFERTEKFLNAHLRNKYID
jgi:dipeptidyl aminopeptidase/acylaminoacyl peptidase